MARRIELGAGLAAAVLTVLTLAALLVAPIVTVCPGHAAIENCPTNLQYISLVAAGKQVYAGTWIFIIVMALLTLVGGIGALLESALGRPRGALLLWPAAVIAFAGCALTGLAGGALSLFFLPPVLAVSIAACAAIAARRAAARRQREAAEGGSGADERPGGYFGRGEL